MRVVYVGNVGEEGTAMALHARNIAELLHLNGHDVTFLCSYPNPNKEKMQSDAYFLYKYAKGTSDIPGIRRLELYADNVFGKKLVKMLRHEEMAHHIDAVIIYGYSGEREIIQFCKKNKIKVFADRTDWFEIDDYSNMYSKWYCKNVSDRCIEKYDRDLDGVISISKYFEDHYRMLGVKTVWIPPIFRKSDISNDVLRTEGQVLRLVYAGSLGGNKDLLDPIVMSLLEINANDIRIELSVVGISEDTMNSHYGRKDWNKYGITIYGRKPHSETIQIERMADFGILLRNDKRYAKAGFSTKFAECMGLGVPMFCTAVGGADLFITHMKNGILIERNSEECIKSHLLELLTLTEEEISEMRCNALELAQELFVMDNYREQLEMLIQG